MGDRESGASSPGEHLFSDSRSIYSLEIKGLWSTGCLVLPGGAGAGKGSVGLASPLLSLPGAFLQMTGHTLGLPRPLCVCAISWGPTIPAVREKTGTEHQSWGCQPDLNPSFVTSCVTLSKLLNLSVPQFFHQ